MRRCGGGKGIFSLRCVLEVNSRQCYGHCVDLSFPQPGKLCHHTAAAHLGTARRKPNIFHVQTSLRRLLSACQSSHTMLRTLFRALRKFLLFSIALGFAWNECAAVPKPHVITFGRWISVKWPNATGQKLLDLKVRPLFVDTRLKEYTTGTPHELTDRMFVVRRAFRVNDALPTENASANSNVPRW